MIRRGFHTLGETGEISAPAYPANESEPVMLGCNPEADYSGPDTPLLDTAEALSIISQLSDATRQIADSLFKEQLKRELNSSNAKAQEAIGRVNEARLKMNEVQSRLNEVNSAINSLVSNLNGFRQTLASLDQQIANLQSQINSIQQSISTLQANVSSLQTQLKALQSSAGRAKYPAGLAGTQQWRADQLAMNNQIKDTQLKILDDYKQKDQIVDSKNGAGQQKNDAITQMNSLADQIKTQYGIAKGLEALRNGFAQDANKAMADVKSAVNDAQNAVSDYLNKAEGILRPLSECSAGSKVLASALAKFDKDKWASGAGDLLRGGLEGGIRNFGDSSLTGASIFGGQAISAISEGVQKTIDNSNSANIWENLSLFTQNVAISTGNAFVGLNYWMAGMDSLELSSAILNNPNNPNAGVDAVNEWAVNGIPNFVLGVGKPVSEASFFFVGPSGPVIGQQITDTLAIASSALVQTATQMTLAPLSASLTPGEYTPRPMGRSLFYPPEGFGNKGSVGTVAIVGFGKGLIELGKTVILGGIENNPGGVAQINKALTDLTRVYSEQNKLRGSVEIRPTDIPTGIPVKIGGD